jgi:hypothetical protein
MPAEVTLPDVPVVLLAPDVPVVTVFVAPLSVVTPLLPVTARSVLSSGSEGLGSPQAANNKASVGGAKINVERIGSSLSLRENYQQILS